MALAIAAPTAFATPIPIAPGGSVTTFTPNTSAFTGTFADSFSQTFSNSFENGTVNELIYRSGGDLDFYYQVINNSSSSDSLTRITVSGYTGYTTSVDYLMNGGDAPTRATRQAAGDSVGFYFSVAPGTDSDWLEVASNATAYNSTGAIALIDSLSVNLTNVPGPVPFTSTPEPVSLGLISAGLLIAGAVRVRSKNRKS